MSSEPGRENTQNAVAISGVSIHYTRLDPSGFVGKQDTLFGHMNLPAVGRYSTVAMRDRQAAGTVVLRTRHSNSPWRGEFDAANSQKLTMFHPNLLKM